MVDKPAHLKVDLALGQVEVSGSEEFIRSVLPELRDWVSAYEQRSEAMNSNSANAELTEQDNTIIESNEPAAPRVLGAATRVRNMATVRTRRATPTMTAPQPVNITGDSTSPSLADFIAEKRPEGDNHTELVTVMSYYLIKYAGLTAVIPGHVVSCYTHLGIRKPKDFDVIFRNTKNRKRWLHGGKAGYTLTNSGDNFVAHDLPREKKG